MSVDDALEIAAELRAEGEPDAEAMVNIHPDMLLSLAAEVLRLRRHGERVEQRALTLCRVIKHQVDLERALRNARIIGADWTGAALALEAVLKGEKR